MADLDPQTTADFWAAYVRVAGGHAKPAQAGRTFAAAPPELCSPVGGQWRIQPAA